MAGPLVADRVKETSTTTGTGTLDLAGPASGFQGFVAGVGTANKCYYSIFEQSGTDWEVGEGTVTDAATDTLSRDRVHNSSNGGSLVNFGAGTKDVFITFPASGWGPVFPFTKPVNGDFSWINQGTASVAESNGGLLTNDAICVTLPDEGGSYSLRIRKKSAPSTPYTVTAAMLATYDVSDSAPLFYGIGFRQSSDGKCVVGMKGCYNSSSGDYLQWTKFNSPTSLSAAYFGKFWSGYDSPVTWMRIEDDGTDRKFHLSADGVHWQEVHSVGRTDFMTADEILFFGTGHNAAGHVTLLSWKEE